MHVSRVRVAAAHGFARALASPKRAFAFAHLWPIVTSYLQVFAGTSGRLVLQAVYFIVLANSLTLGDMGNFASASAVGIMIGAFTGLGFSAIAFQAAAGRQRLLGRYFGIFLATASATTPVALLLSAPVYFVIFRDGLPLLTFMMIMIVEVLMSKLIEGLHKINNGLGRFASASLVLIILTASRAAAAVLFAVSGSASLETWVNIYFAANVLTTLAAFALLTPRLRIKWDTKLFVARVRDAILFAFSSLTFDAQTEVDKLVFLAAAGDRAAGIYAISVRIIELAIIPIRTFFVLYSRKLIRERRTDNIVLRNLSIEIGIFCATVTAYAVFLALLSIKPDLLGPNVEVARQLFGAALLVPAFRSMMELHSELYFAYRRLGTQAVVTLALVLIKAGLIAIVVSASDDPSTWGHQMNWIFAGLYAVSVIAVYRAIAMPRRLPPAFAEVDP